MHGYVIIEWLEDGLPSLGLAEQNRYLMHSIIRWSLTLIFGVAIASAPNTPLNTTTTIQDAILRGEPNITYTVPSPDWRVGLKHYQELLKLEQCESGGVYRVVLDTNDKYSYGWLQFQLPTFRKYGIKYAFFAPTVSQEELLTLIKDRSTQFQIASKVLDEKDGIYNWTNCARIVGLIP